MALMIGDAAGILNRGTYSGATAYVMNDVVIYNGVPYVALANTTGNLPTNTTYWMPLSSLGAGLPAAGSTGQALVKNSGTTNDTKWATANITVTATATPGWTLPVTSTPLYYDNRISAANSSVSTTFTSGRGYYLPFITAQTIQVDQLGIISGASTGTVQVGLFTPNGSNAPGALVASGTVNYAATNIAYTTSFTAVSVNVGLNFLAVMPIGANTSIRVVGSTSVPVRAMNSSPQTTNAYVGYQTTATGLAGLAANPTAAVYTATSIPLIFVRAWV